MKEANAAKKILLCRHCTDCINRHDKNKKLSCCRGTARPLSYENLVQLNQVLQSRFKVKGHSYRWKLEVDGKRVGNAYRNAHTDGRTARKHNASDAAYCMGGRIKIQRGNRNRGPILKTS